MPEVNKHNQMVEMEFIFEYLLNGTVIR